MRAAKSSVGLFCRCSEPLRPEQRQDTFNVYHALGKKVGLDNSCHRNQTWTNIFMSDGNNGFPNIYTAVPSC